MSDGTLPIGAIVWADLTVPNAAGVRDFYRAIVGWTAEEVPMEDETGAYADFTMKDTAGNNAAGVCHARGYNADLPPQWILYFNVADPGESVHRCRELGGKVLREQDDGAGNLVYALIQDPAGAVVALMKA